MFKYPKILIKLGILLLTSIVYIFSPKNSLAFSSISEWTSVTQMPTSSNTASHYSFVFDNKIYSLGGASTSVSANGIYSTISPTGSLSNWSNITTAPTVLWHAGAQYNNFVYLLGGANASINNINEVKVGSIDSTGNINWINSTPLPYSVGLGASVIVGNKIYYAGGSTNEESASSAKSEIYKADINPTDGTIGNWTLAGNLPHQMLGFGMVESNGHLIIFGGKMAGDIYLSEVKKTDINNVTGNIGTWTNLPSLPNSVYRGGFTKVGNLLISAGGYNISPSFTLLDNVNYAEIDGNGEIATWNSSSNKLPQATCCFALTSRGNFVYMTGGWTGSYTNNVSVTEVNTISPTPSPTPIPTASPSPTPVIPILNVDDLKQYSILWEDDLYDHTEATIKQWGCALTSASMILKYHGHDILPDALNNWLNLEPDGFIRNGLINWLAVSRYTKDNYSPTSRTLEYRRLSPSETNLDTELLNYRPAILKENGHFVVATGKLTDTYTINDPGYSDRSTLDSYENNYLAINSYTPTDSDLSYMMFAADEDIDFELIDSDGNIVETQNFIEEPINDIDNPLNKSGEQLSILLFEKPESGEYKLKVSGAPGNYELDTYLYDIDGEVIQNKFEGLLLDGDTDTFDISFDPINNIDLSTEEILKNLDNAFSNSLVKNKGIYQSIKTHLRIYERFHSDKIIELLIKQIKMLTPKLINQNFSNVLQQNLQTLLN